MYFQFVLFIANPYHTIEGEGGRNRAVQTMPHMVKARRLRPYHRKSIPYHRGGGGQNKAVQTIPCMVKARRLRPYHQGHDLHSRPYHMGAIPPETDGKERLYYELSGIKRPILNGPHTCLFARFCSPHEPVVVFCVRPGGV